MTEIAIIDRLLAGEGVSLAAWYAEPLAPGQAQARLDALHRRLRSQRGTAAGSFAVRLAELILRYWARDPVEAAYMTLAAVLPGDSEERAVLELALGQLLIARRRADAWAHLEQGFRLAAHRLEPEAYFTVLRRHELLRQLPPAPGSQAAAPLEALLEEARVIARLKGRGARMPVPAPVHRDTLD